MENFDRKKHWENIYQTKDLKDVSWYQARPETSLQFLKELGIPKNAKIIDVGGGDSYLADHLLENGFTDITVVDISEAALARAKKRLADKAAKVKWICSDAASFQPEEKYDFWHDRAAFHFLTDEKEIEAYVTTIREHVSPGGILVIGTFSEQGPQKCSGIAIKQYTAASLSKRFEAAFEKINCFYIDHQTPFDTLQNFVFCSFKRKTEPLN